MATSAEIKARQAFFELWTTSPSWNPITLSADGWKTVTSESGKQVPLRAESIELAYRNGAIIGKRFGQFTNYLMIDIDRGSQYHPANGSIETILCALESIGLCRCLILLSSDSQGLHLHFPLESPVRSWALASATYQVLNETGVKIEGGQCELFPHLKAYGAGYNGHRLPLQQGSYLLDENFGPISNNFVGFIAQWELAAAGNDFEESTTQAKQIVVPSNSLPPIWFDGPGQTNEVMKRLANWGAEKLRLLTVPELVHWISSTVTLLPGYSEFASPDSKDDIERKNWALRWAKSNLRARRNFKIEKASSDHNAAVANDALNRLQVCLTEFGDQIFSSARQLWDSLNKIGKNKFSLSFGWKTFKKHLRDCTEFCVSGLRSYQVRRIPHHGPQEKRTEPR